MSASQVSFFVNEAYMEIAEAVPHALLEKYVHTSTASGQARYPLPTDFGTPLVIALSSATSSTGTALCDVPSYKTLMWLSPAQFQVSDTTHNGEPEGFILYENEIGLKPTPDSTYPLAIRYKAMVSDITSTSAVPSVSTPWRRAILLRTIEMIHASLGDVEAESVAGQRYRAYVSQLDSDHVKRQRNSSGQAAAHVYQHPDGA